MTSFLPTGALHSPDLGTVSDFFYDTYFKQELSHYQRHSCLVPNTLPLDHHETLPSFLESSPLTPQSSYYSSNSPQSHSSLQSPEPGCEAEQCSSNHFDGSSSAMASSPISPNNLPGYEASSDDPCALDIAASLELITDSRASVIPSNSHYSGAYSYAPLPNSSFPLCTPEFTHQGFSAYSPQAEFELLQMMPNPDDLLVDPFCPASSKDVKPLINSNPMTPLTPIH